MRQGITIILFIIAGQLSGNSQVLNHIEDLTLNLPCKMTLSYDENSSKSYSCQSLVDNNPIAYRVTIDDFTNKLINLTEREIRDFLKLYFIKIKMSAESNSENVLECSIFNVKAIQFDDHFEMGDMTLQARTMVFIANKKCISLNYIATKAGFETGYNRFLGNVKMVGSVR